MYTIKNEVTYKQIINKSIFISYLFPVKSEDDAKEKLNQIREKHYDATHNCYCYIVGYNASIIKFSDDGEPQGTAGVIIYNCLQKKSLTNVLAIVTRYFGGIKLGAGGLVRAYSSSTALALENAEIIEIVKYITLKITSNYQNLKILEKYLSDYEIKNKEFKEKVYFEVVIPETEKDKLKAKLIDITKDEVLISFE